MDARGSYNRWGFLVGLDYEFWPAEKVVETLAGQGFGALEWSLTHFDPRSMLASQLDGVVKMTRSQGMEVSEIVVQQDLVCTDPDALQARVDLTIDTARAAVGSGVTLINVTTGPNRWENDHVDVGNSMVEGKAWTLMLDAYEKMLDGLALVGAQAALEPCWGGLAHDFHSTGIMLRRFAKHPAFAINFDPSHFALARDDMDLAVAELAPFIRHVHIKDVAGRPGAEGNDFIFPLIGEGLVNWPSFFGALSNLNYSGFLSVEFESYRFYENILKSDPAKASALSMEHLRALEEYLPEELKS